VRRAPGRQLAARQPIDPPAVHHDGAARGRVEAADQVEQGRLARARRAHQRHEVAAGDVEVDAVQDLDRLAAAPVALGDGADLDQVGHQVLSASLTASPPLSDAGGRSEEHTSELQSLAYLVCRLLLEKKKKKKKHLVEKKKIKNKNNRYGKTTLVQRNLSILDTTSNKVTHRLTPSNI